VKFGSVCSGIEAASVAWEPLGWKATWFSEIEPFPSAVLAHHYPDTPNLGDMTTLPDRIRSGEVAAPDLFCGGTPCQAFSVAGLRKSLDDARGNLSLTFCEIANAIDHVRHAQGEQPCIVFWENVPGVLNTKDNAFGCFLGALAGTDTAIVPSGGRWTDAGVVDGPERTVAWRTLDAQYFGVAQRRRRVFVVASARDGFDPAEVLFEWDGVRRDSAPSREARETTAHATAPCPTSSGRGVGRTGETRGQDPVVAVCPTLRAGGNHTGGDRPPGTDVDTADSLIITMAHGQGGAEIGFDRGPTLTCNHEAPIAAYPVGVTIHGTDGTARVASYSDTAQCLRARAPGNIDNSSTTVVQQPVAYSIMPMNSGKDYKAREVEVAQPLMASGPVGGNQGGDFIAQPVASDTTQITSPANVSNPKPGDPCHPLAAGAHAPAIAFSAKDYGGDAISDLSPTLRAGGHASSHANAGVMPAIAFHPTQDPIHSSDGSTHAMGTGSAGGCATVAIALQDVRTMNKAQNGRGWNDDGISYTVDTHATQGVAVAFEENFHAVREVDVAPAMTTQGYRVSQNAGGLGLRTAMQVRRLTPVECERLQGFPDNYTAIPWRKKPASECPDGPRYKALGNSWAVPVVRWIGDRIEKACRNT
jgi:DNA (cytosine-5)-methyltransferase 1